MGLFDAAVKRMSKLGPDIASAGNLGALSIPGNGTTIGSDSNLLFGPVQT
jgi:hypothetical protein